MKDEINNKSHKYLNADNLIEVISKISNNEKELRLLWECCQIPDFVKKNYGHHIEVVRKVFDFLRKDPGRISNNYMKQQLSTLDKMDGNVDSISNKQIRNQVIRDSLRFTGIRLDLIRIKLDWDPIRFDPIRPTSNSTTFRPTYSNSTTLDQVSTLECRNLVQSCRIRSRAN